MAYVRRTIRNRSVFNLPAIGDPILDAETIHARRWGILSVLIVSLLVNCKSACFSLDWLISLRILSAVRLGPRS